MQNFAERYVDTPSFTVKFLYPHDGGNNDMDDLESKSISLYEAIIDVNYEYWITEHDRLDVDKKISDPKSRIPLPHEIPSSFPVG